MNNVYSLLATSASTVFIACLTVVVVILFIAVVCLLWWTELKQKSVKDLWKIIRRSFKSMAEKISPNKPVKTVYSDKSRNYSGTEFLPVPAKAPTKEYTYEFVGWDKNYVDANGNTVARPIYIQKVNTCRINVYDDDETTLLKTDVIEYGAGIDLSDLHPTKLATKEFTYEFVGWDKDTTNFYKSDNVYAVYKAIPKMFTYTFFDQDGKSIISQTTAIYGTPILVPEPPKNDDLNTEFAYWKGYEEGMILTKDEYFVAVFRRIEQPEQLNEPVNVVMQQQSLSSLEYDREELSDSSAVVNQEKIDINSAEAEDKNKDNSIFKQALKVFHLAGANKVESESPKPEIKLNSEVEQNKPEEEKREVQKLVPVNNEDNIDEIASSITVLGRKNKND